MSNHCSRVRAAAKVRPKPRGARGQMEWAMLVPAPWRAVPGTRLVRDSREHAVDVKMRQLRTAPSLARDVFREALPPLEPLRDVRLVARKHRAKDGARTGTQLGRRRADGRAQQRAAERSVMVTETIRGTRTGHATRSAHRSFANFDTRGFGAPSTALALHEPSLVVRRRRVGDRPIRDTPRGTDASARHSGSRRCSCVTAGSKTAPFVTLVAAPRRATRPGLITGLRPVPYRRTSIYRYGAVRDLPRPG